MKYGERLRIAREHRSLSQTELAERVGMAQPSINYLEDLSNDAKGSKYTPQLARELKINVNWLADEKGEMIEREQIDQSVPEAITYQVREPSKKYDNHRPDEILLQQFDATGRMGNGGAVLDGQPSVIRSWSVSPEWVSQNIRAHSGVKNLCIVTGLNDSMQPLFNSGDPLIIDTGITTVESEGVYYFRVGDEGLIKRLQPIPGVGIRVISANKEYETWTIREDMDFEVFGRVLKVWCSVDL